MKQEKSAAELRRRVSRVESLRRLILGASHIDSKRLFERRRYRFGSRGSVSKADKAIGTDLDFMVVGSEDDLFDRSSSRFNVSCDSFEMDSVSQLSLADTSTSDTKYTLSAASKSISIDNIPSELVTSGFLRTSTSNTFMKPKLAALPEEQNGVGANGGTLTRHKVVDDKLRHDNGFVLDNGGDSDIQMYREVRSLAPVTPSSSASGVLRRKKSQSLADIHISQLQVPAQFRTEHHHHPDTDTLRPNHKKFSKTKSEESGYDSDTTRKSGSSPRGSVKSDSFDPSETDSSTCDTNSKPGEEACNSGDYDSVQSNEDASTSQASVLSIAKAAAPSSNTAPSSLTSPTQTRPKIKKPPRKSKEMAPLQQHQLQQVQVHAPPQQEQSHPQLPTAHEQIQPPARTEISCQTEFVPIQSATKLSSQQTLTKISKSSDSVTVTSQTATTTETSSSTTKLSPSLPISFPDKVLTTLPSLTSKSFKMLRLVKSDTDELGIIISKKKNPSKGTTGYIIAHIESEGLVNK